MASVLASLHGQGMVHMDVKPDNIMVGDDGAYKLGDFGLAARLDGAGGSITEGDSRCAAGLLLIPSVCRSMQHTSAACEPMVMQHQSCFRVPRQRLSALLMSSVTWCCVCAGTSRVRC